MTDGDYILKTLGELVREAKKQGEAKYISQQWI